MTNRAVRRQQLKDKAADESKAAKRPARSAMPKLGASPAAAKGTSSGFAGGARRQVSDVIGELRKVVWPKREDVVHLTVVIVIVTIIIGAFLGLVDIGFSWLIDKTLLGR